MHQTFTFPKESSAYTCGYACLRRYSLQHGSAFGLSHGLDQLALMRPPLKDPKVGMCGLTPKNAVVMD